MKIWWYLIPYTYFQALSKHFQNIRVREYTWTIRNRSITIPLIASNLYNNIQIIEGGRWSSNEANIEFDGKEITVYVEDEYGRLSKVITPDAQNVRDIHLYMFLLLYLNKLIHLREDDEKIIREILFL